MIEIVGFLQGAADHVVQDGGQIAPFNVDRLLGVVGLVLAIVAAGLAYQHLRRMHDVLKNIRAVLQEAKHQEEQAEFHAGRLSEIKESLSTRYLGEFPKYFPKIVEVIQKAEERVIILCDYPGYGSFTDRKAWLSYKHAIEQQTSNPKMTIELTCFDEKLRRKNVEEQFFDESEWDNWKLEQRNAERLEELLKWHEGSPTVSALSKEQFAELLANEEQQALDVTFATADKKQIDTYMPLYFWVADEKRAVFAIGSLSDREYGFFTLDRQIISALIEMRNRYHRGAANPPAP